MRDDYRVDQCDTLGNTVDTVSLYTLTPGVTSSFRALRVCTSICPKSDLDFVLKELSGKDTDEPLSDPYVVFTENGASGATISCCSALLFLTLLFFSI